MTKEEIIEMLEKENQAYHNLMQLTIKWRDEEKNPETKKMHDRLLYLYSAQSCAIDSILTMIADKEKEESK